MRLYIVEPTNENGRDEYRKAKKHKYGIGLRERGRVDQIEFESQYCHNEERDKREAGSETRDSVRPVDGIKHEDIPDNGKDKRNQVDLKGSKDDIVLVKIEDPPEYI